MNTKKISVCVCLIVMIFIVSSNVFANNKKSILVINSYSPSFPTYSQYIRGLGSQLKDLNVILDIEFMDSKRFFTNQNFTKFYEILKYKINQVGGYDLVIVCDDNALNFTLKHKNELFKDIPIVFLGINNIDKAKFASKDKWVTGVVEHVSLKETLETAIRLQPKARRITLITDNTNSCTGIISSNKEVIESIDKLDVIELNFSEVPINEFKNKLNEVNKDDIVLLLSAYRDYEFNSIEFVESLEIIKSNCQAPIYHLWEHGMGDGIIGGKLVSHYEQGVTASKYTKEILLGKEVEELPLILESPNKFLFDAKELAKHRILEWNLPKDSEVINKKISFVMKYIEAILILSGIIIAMGLFIGILLRNTKKRQKSENDLKVKNKELATLYEELKQKRDTIYDLAYYDQLTLLPNRTYFYEKLNETMAIDENKEFAILFLDIDNFKVINDIYGHSIGDQVLVKIAIKLKDKLKDNSFISRIGGDEFIIILNDIYVDNNLQTNIDNIIGIAKETIYMGTNEFYVTLSMGVAVYPHNGKTVEELLMNADAAMNLSKEKGKNGYAIYENQMFLDIHRKLQLQSSLRNALANNEFEIYYQPQLDLSNGEICGLEALLRWNSQKYGMVSPLEFIQLAEEIGIIVDIGKWVLREACRFVKKINEGNDRDITIHVNISPRQLIERDFTEDVLRIIEEEQINPKYIGLEITETILIKMFKNVNVKLDKLRNKGIHISLDDFGTGYSSLNSLKQLSINILKIDKVFTDEIEKESKGKGIIELIIKISQQMGLKVIAEGIESFEQLKILEKMNCNIIQGYYLSKPITEEEALEFVRQKVDKN